MAPERPQGPLAGESLRMSECEEPLRILVLGDPASGKTALLQLLQQHAADLARTCVAQEEEDQTISAGTGS